MTGKHWTAQEIELIKNNYGQFSRKEMKENFIPNRTIEAIGAIATKLGLCRKTHSIDANYFCDINSNNSYWAGFIAADGYIVKTSVRTELNINDKNHLLKLKEEIKFDGPVVDCKHYSKKYNKFYYSSYLDLNGDFGSLSSDLNTNFNIAYGKKSLVLQPPYRLTEEDFIRSFIRGYMDGDGSIHFNNQEFWQVAFVGTEEMVNWIKGKLQYFIDEVRNPSVLPSSSIFRVTFCGKQVLPILDWLYENSTSSLRLDRKYENYFNVYEFHKYKY